MSEFRVLKKLHTAFKHTFFSGSPHEEDALQIVLIEFKRILTGLLPLLWEKDIKLMKSHCGWYNRNGFVSLYIC